MRKMTRGFSLPETIVAATVFLLVFKATMELLPFLTVPDSEGRLMTEAIYRIEELAEKYGSGLWPSGSYVERYEWGEIDVTIAPYRYRHDLQCITLRARFGECRRTITQIRLARCRK